MGLLVAFPVPGPECNAGDPDPAGTPTSTRAWRSLCTRLVSGPDLGVLHCNPSLPDLPRLFIHARMNTHVPTASLLRKPCHMAWQAS
jgi:hypothetical protein